MSAAASALSKSRVNRAGDSLRRFSELIHEGKHDELSEALDVLVKWRTSHNTPLRTATMGLRSRVKTEKCEVEVSQRLKRIPTIIDKLYREPGMKLARMADIGGCRAVLDSIDEVRRVEARLCKQRPPKIYHDYIDKAKIHSATLRGSANKLKSYAIRQLLSHSFGQIQNAKVIIDGQDIKGFGITDEAYLLKMVNRESPGTLRAVRFGDSTTNVGLQLADMMAGAIQHGVRTHLPSDSTYLKRIRHRTYQPQGTLWHFCR